MKRNDTICAPATLPGTGAITIIRISGERTFEVLDKVMKFTHGSAADAKGYTLKRAQFSDIDDVVVAFFRAPASYTGEDAAEIYCHASSYIAQKALDLLCKAGCTLAEPGEFTQRAFLSGKMDLAQAEAVADVIAAQSEAQHRIAFTQLRGGYSAELREIRSKLLELSSLVELELDFSEEELEFADRSRLTELLEIARGKCRKLADSFRLGNAIRNGVPTAIVGAPNSGKSTLLNALLKDDRAIVSDIAGTTRDTVEECCVVGGVQFRFIDTAGIRESDDPIERLGIERSIGKIPQAELVIIVVDVLSPTAKDELEMVLDKCDTVRQNIIVFVNKVDAIEGKIDDNKNVKGLNLFVSSFVDKGVDIKLVFGSAKTGIGLEMLDELLGKWGKESSRSSNLVTNARHAQVLSRTADQLDTVLSGILGGSVPTDLLAEDLRLAVSSLGEITGEISNDEVLGSIFARFCIGK